DGDVAEQPHAAGLDVDLDQGEVGAVGERPRFGVGVVHGGLQAGFQAAELARSKVDDTGQLAEGQAPIGAASHDGAAVAKLDVVGARLQQDGGEPADLVSERAGREGGG